MPIIELGDIVTVHPEGLLPKAKWKLGKVERLVAGIAVVRVGNSEGLSTCTRRPIQKLVSTRGATC